jgi:hypothetical protein
MTQLPVGWQRLIGADGRTCQGCDATHQHRQSAVAKMRDVLKPLHIEPILARRETAGRPFKDKSAESNRIGTARKPVTGAAGVDNSYGCPVCGATNFRTMKIEGAVFEGIPKAIILKVAHVAASGLIGETA